MNAATVLSAEPDSHRPVAGRFDLQRIDGNRLAVCWAAHDDHARLVAEYRATKPEDAAGRGHRRRSGVSAGRRVAAAGRQRLVRRGRPVAREAAGRGRLPRRRSDGARRGRNHPGRFLRSFGAAGRGRAVLCAVGPLHAAAAGAGDARDGPDASGQSDLRGDGPRPSAARGRHGGPGDAAGVPAA